MQNSKVAMSPWELKWPLRGGRLDFQVSKRFSYVGQAAQRTRARAGGEFCTAQNRTVAMLPWKLKLPLSGGRLDIQVNM